MFTFMPAQMRMACRSLSAGTARDAIQRFPSTLARSARDSFCFSSSPAVQPPPIMKAPEVICLRVRCRPA